MIDKSTNVVPAANVIVLAFDATAAAWVATIGADTGHALSVKSWTPDGAIIGLVGEIKTNGWSFEADRGPVPDADAEGAAPAPSPSTPPEPAPNAV